MSAGPSLCRYCGAPILWARTTKGRRIPLDPDPTPRGNLTMTDGLAETCRTPLADPLPPLYTSHFATCPSADQARKGGSRA